MAWGCAGAAVGGVCPPPFLFVFFFSGCGEGCGSRPCRVVALWCLLLPVPVLGLLVPPPPSPFVWAASLPPFFLLARHFSGGVHAGLSGVSFPPVGRCSRLRVLGFGWVVLWCSFGGPRGYRLWCCLAGGSAGLLWIGCAVSRLCICLLPPPFFLLARSWFGGASPPSVLFVCPFFWGGGTRLFLPLPFLGWCKHWSAFGVANRVVSWCCAWLGLAPAAWLGWVMYTLGQVAYPVRLGSGPAGCVVAPGRFVGPGVKGLGFSM